MQMIGRTISHYTILEKLGEGGMGVVYKALDTRLDRTVALKFLPQHLMSHEPERSRFLLEARAASSMSHQNICHINAIEETGEQQFIDMEYVDGVTLRKKLEQAPIPAGESIDYALQIAEALQEAHSKGVVHRDIKADNVMVDTKNQIKVMDFGLAKLKGAPKLTRSSSTVGTLAYMSPEQIRGGEVDARSDLFSFGVLLFEMLTARMPFRGEHEAAMMYSIMNEEPEPIQVVLPGLPSGFVHLIAKALKKNPDDRYQSVGEMIADLRRVKKQSSAVSRTVPAAMNLVDDRPPALRQEPRRGFRAGRPGWRKVTIVLVLVVTLAGYFLLSKLNTADAPEVLRLSFRQITEAEGRQFNPDISPDGNFIAYESDAGHGVPHKIFLQRISGGNPIDLTPEIRESAGQPAFSPDGQTIAFRSEQAGGGILLMGATGENTRRLTDFGYNPAWSPDGKKILVATEGIEDPNARTGVSELWIIDVATGEKRRMSGGDVVQPQWSPHGYRIAYWTKHRGGERDIWTMSAGGGDSIPVTNDSYVDWSPIWAPDGRFLYFSSDRGGSMNVWRIEIDEKTGKTVGIPRPVTTPSQYSGFVRMSHDGRHLVYSAIQSYIHLYKIGFDPVREAGVGSGIAITHGAKTISNAVPSPDDEWIAFYSGGTQEDIYTIRRDGTGLRQLTNDLAKDRYPVWSPDGKRIAFMSGRSGSYEIWSINSDGSNPERLTKTHFGYIIPTYWFPDGKTLLCTTDSGAVLFDLQKPLGDRRAESFPASGKDDETFFNAVGSPDGKMLAGFYGGASFPGVTLYSMQDKVYESLTDSADWSYPCWLHDNRRLLYKRNGRTFIVDRTTKKTHEVMNLPPLGDFLFSAHLADDDHTLFYISGAGEAHLWEAVMQ